jgi:hypothetical protein
MRRGVTDSGSGGAIVEKTQYGIKRFPGAERRMDPRLSA